MAPSTWPDKHSTQPSSLRQNSSHDSAVDIGQPEVAAGIPIGEPLVIEAHEVQNRLVKVVNMNRVFYGLKTKLIGCPVNRPSPHTASGQHH